MILSVASIYPSQKKIQFENKNYDPAKPDSKEPEFLKFTFNEFINNEFDNIYDYTKFKPFYSEEPKFHGDIFNLFSGFRV